jgi:capsular polysaccharide biosynthesis protein
MLVEIKEFLKKNLPESIKILLIRIFPFFTQSKWRCKVVFFLFNTNIFNRSYIHILTSKQYEFRDLITIGEAFCFKSQNIDFLYNSKLLLHYYSPTFNLSIEGKEFNKIAYGYKKYGIEIKDVEIIACSDLVLINSNNALYDLKEANLQGRYAYTDEAIVCYEKSKCLLKKENKSEVIIDEAISLIGNYSWNFYHMMFEILTKFRNIHESNISLKIPVIIDKICLDIPQYLELINIFNNPKREIISLKKGERYKVNKLYYFSKVNLIPPNYITGSEIKDCDTLFDLTSLEYLRSKLLTHGSRKDFPKRIFLTRKNASNRRKYNEQEVFDVLKGFRFEEIIPENYSIADQVRMFNSAEIIVGGSGAAFTNLIFCSEGCKAIIFTYNELPFSGFSTLAKFAAVDLVYLTAVFGYDNSVDIHKDFSINKQNLKDFMSNWID